MGDSLVLTCLHALRTPPITVAGFPATIHASCCLDLALLHVPSLPPSPAPTFSTPLPDTRLVLARPRTDLAATACDISTILYTSLAPLPVLALTCSAIRGDSGGALFDTAGNVAGIVVYAAKDTTYAVPGGLVAHFISSARGGGTVPIYAVRRLVASPHPDGVLVHSACETSNLRPGDVLTSACGHAITDGHVDAFGSRMPAGAAFLSGGGACVVRRAGDDVALDVATVAAEESAATFGTATADFANAALAEVTLAWLQERFGDEWGAACGPALRAAVFESDAAPAVVVVAGEGEGCVVVSLAGERGAGIGDVVAAAREARRRGSSAIGASLSDGRVVEFALG